MDLSDASSEKEDFDALEHFLQGVVNSSMGSKNKINKFKIYENVLYFDLLIDIPLSYGGGGHIIVANEYFYIFKRYIERSPSPSQAVSKHASTIQISCQLSVNDDSKNEIIGTSDMYKMLESEVGKYSYIVDKLKDIYTQDRHAELSRFRSEWEVLERERHADIAEKARKVWTEKQRIEAEREEFLFQEKQRARQERELRERTKRLERELKEQTEKLERELREKKERQERELKENLRREHLRQLRQKLHDDFLNADQIYEAEFSKSLNREEFFREKALYVQDWVKEECGFDLDEEQARAVSSVQGHVQVTARAGSGKTATLINRAFFLQKHCGVPPNEMLLVAFNTKAADEIFARLNKLLGHKTPHIMTFHALAYSIVHPEETILHDGPQGENQGLSAVFQEVIDEHLQIDIFKKQLRELMLAHYREDWFKIVAGGFDKSEEEFRRYRRSLVQESLNGDYVKSYGEKIIADFLFEHDLPYKYERNHWWGNRNYRPDFTIFKSDGKSGAIIEYFGMVGDPEYDEMAQQKREYWKSKSQWTLIEVSPRDITGDGVTNFYNKIRAELEKIGLHCDRLPEEEIWRRVRVRAINRFTAAAKSFIGRCRKRWILPNEMGSMIDGYKPFSNVEGQFLIVVNKLYKAYLERLIATGEDDFDGLIQSAVTAIDEGKTVFDRKNERGDIKSFRYIFIDEFQDFSELFSRLMNSVYQQNPSAKFFCVGDDWQAINSFAGSDLKYFREFGERYANATLLDVSTNYRSLSSIVNFGNALMNGLGKPARAHESSVGQVGLADISDFKPTLLEQKRHPGDKITPVVLRLVKKYLENGGKIHLLARRHGLPWFVNYQQHSEGGHSALEKFLNLIRSYFSDEIAKRINISTTHGFKGGQEDVVIILDALAGSYPLIHPDWIFSRILGDDLSKIQEEERRLFYVALTRAKSELIVITDNEKRSPFLDDISKKQNISNVDLFKLSPVQGKTSYVVVVVGNQNNRGSQPTFLIKDLLRAQGFQWRSVGQKGWGNSYPVDGFDISQLKTSPWSQQANGIEVRLFDDYDNEIERYAIDNGHWREVF
jgi:DNA helicase IV